MHVPVMLLETLDALQVQAGRWYVDGTLGGGGHAEEIVRRGGLLLGLDRDGEAVRRTGERLAPWGRQIRLVKGNYRDMKRLAEEADIRDPAGVLLDLGVSSFQLDEPERGFSFQQDGPLDMRMDASGGPTAADLVNRASREELSRIFREYGEEPAAWRMAGAVVEERGRAPFEQTGRLADTLARAAGGRRGRLHPATRAFQALRIAVNDELEGLREGLEAGLALLAPGGRMAVISFHSLEDRLVKQTFREHAGRMEALAQGGEQWAGLTPRIQRLRGGARQATAEEVRSNPRARSAKLRVAERM